MWKILVDTVVKPALRRAGTAGAALLVVGGDWLCENINACGLVTEGGAAQVMSYVVAVALLAMDLSMSYMHDRKKGG